MSVHRGLRWTAGASHALGRGLRSVACATLRDGGAASPSSSGTKCQREFRVTRCRSRSFPQALGEQPARRACSAPFAGLAYRVLDADAATATARICERIELLSQSPNRARLVNPAVRRLKGVETVKTAAWRRMCVARSGRTSITPCRTGRTRSTPAASTRVDQARAGPSTLVPPGATDVGTTARGSRRRAGTNGCSRPADRRCAVVVAGTLRRQLT